jgi:hypothetical protein
VSAVLKLTNKNSKEAKDECKEPQVLLEKPLDFDIKNTLLVR